MKLKTESFKTEECRIEFKNRNIYTIVVVVVVLRSSSGDYKPDEEAETVDHVDDQINMKDTATKK